MHQVLEKIKSDLLEVIQSISDHIPNNEPFGNIHNNWTFPGITKEELIEDAQEIIDLITDSGGENLGDNEERIIDYSRRLNHLSINTIPNLWSNSNQAVPCYIFTLQGLRKALSTALSKDTEKESSIKLRNLAKKIRSMESRVNDLDPRTETISNLVERIEQAHSAADQLPTDLETLQEAQRAINKLTKLSESDHSDIKKLLKSTEQEFDHLSVKSRQATAVLEKCETAYSAATSVGLAAAFSERSNTLSKSMWVWVGGLVSALTVGGYFGSRQLDILSKSLESSTSNTFLVILNLGLTLLSVGAPIWFAWLATKQIGQRFRLSEDYAFKAAVSRAYEGYRREAARVDKDMEAQLLASALGRLDELPLRLVETETHGSPWHEVASSDVIKQALRTVPGFSNQVKDFAQNAINSTTSVLNRAAPKREPHDEDIKTDKKPPTE